VILIFWIRAPIASFFIGHKLYRIVRKKSKAIMLLLILNECTFVWLRKKNLGQMLKILFSSFMFTFCL
jgi:hypothetical protein